MTENPIGDQSRGIEPAMSAEAVVTDRMLVAAYRGIRDGLLRRGLIEPILSKNGVPSRKSFKTLPFQGDLPFPLSEKNPQVDLTRTDRL